MQKSEKAACYHAFAAQLVAATTGAPLRELIDRLGELLRGIGRNELDALTAELRKAIYSTLVFILTRLVEEQEDELPNRLKLVYYIVLKAEALLSQAALRCGENLELRDSGYDDAQLKVKHLRKYLLDAGEDKSKATEALADAIYALEDDGAFCWSFVPDIQWQLTIYMLDALRKLPKDNIFHSQIRHINDLSAHLCSPLADGGMSRYALCRLAFRNGRAFSLGYRSFSWLSGRDDAGLVRAQFRFAARALPLQELAAFLREAAKYTEDEAVISVINELREEFAASFGEVR